ncbi:MAG: AraC family transcriptional regulator [Eubacteriales bacterium]|nr:AraC family transcriptional regulator [Eubacteriales bacterium]
MNVHYLMQYVSRQLHTIVRRYTLQGELLETVCERIDFEDCLEAEPEEFRQSLLQSAANAFPVLLADDHSVAYAAAITRNERFLVGPVLLLGGTTYKHKLPERQLFSESWLLSLHHCSPYALLKEILLIHNLFHDSAVLINDAFDFNCLEKKETYEVQKNFTDIVFQNQETAFRHNPFDQEIREFSSIENGDVEQLSKSWEEDYIGRVGILAKEPLRHCQNLGIVLIALAARAAIRGGILSDLAFSLSDSYINQIEEAKNPEAAISLGRKAEYQYAVLVKELKEQRESRKSGQASDSKISRCKDYICSHLHGKISTSDVARELYMNPSYLSDLFKKEEGITISEYILQEKIKLVKNMLIYSQYSYSAIANYLGFTSQSYLGKKFKQATGMTLHQYREKYGVKEFNPEG